MYTYKYGGKTGKEQVVAESRNRLILRTNKTNADVKKAIGDSSQAQLEKFYLEMAFPQANVFVYKVKPEHEGEINLVPKTKSLLKQEVSLKFAGRVLENPETGRPVIYTENIYIKFYDDVSLETCREIFASYGLREKVHHQFAVNAFTVAVPEGIGVKVFDIANRLLEDERVENCHPELITQRVLKTISPEQWHLHPTQINGVNINAHVNIRAAHQETMGEGIVIAVIDDGVDIDHLEFANKIIHQKDTEYDLDNAGHKFFNEMHGTACAGVALSKGEKASGVAPKASLMPIRMGNLGSESEWKAIEWATKNGADIISCSWGPPDGEWDNANDPLHTHMELINDRTRAAIDDAVTKGRNGKGCVIFFAAGNGNEDVRFDGYASYKNVIAVAASNDTDKRSVYSDYGDAVWCCFPSDDSQHDHLNPKGPLTPGIYTADRLGIMGYDRTSDYTSSFGGTSSSCPGVAGIAALILSVNNDLTWLEVKEIIKDSCVKIDTANGKYDAKGHSRFYGYGKPDAAKAVHIARAIKAAKSESVNP